VICLGESTTFGNDVEANYPASLRRILTTRGTPADVINAGVPGWVSDQVALRAEHQLAAYKPDAVILYVGWNDFQSYDPLGPEAAVSYWEFAYKGKTWKQQATTWFKSVALLSAWYHAESRIEMPAVDSVTRRPAGGHYKFLLQNLQRITAAFRAANPEVQIFLSTLVGRWPAGTAEEWKHIAPVWWMPRHDVSVQRAAALVAAMNDEFRMFAARHGVHLIDMAAEFERLDRAKLQYDWAHMISDGYELMAWTMYEALVEAGALRSTGPSARAHRLRVQYAVAAPAAVPAADTGRH
jgi:lysophospholipase L1-like esterase